MYKQHFDRILDDFFVFIFNLYMSIQHKQNVDRRRFVKLCRDLQKILIMNFKFSNGFVHLLFVQRVSSNYSYSQTITIIIIKWIRFLE